MSPPPLQPSAADTQVTTPQELHYVSLIYQSDSTGALASGVHSSGSDGSNVLEQLALRHSRIAHKTNINVTADLHSIRQYPGT